MELREAEQQDEKNEKYINFLKNNIEKLKLEISKYEQTGRL
jgi:hypothetical protein